MWMPGTITYVTVSSTVFFQKIHMSNGNELFIRQGKNEGTETRAMKIPCSPATRRKSLSLVFLQLASQQKSKTGSHLSVPCACRAIEFYFPMCSNGTLTWRRKNTKSAEELADQLSVDSLIIAAGQCLYHTDPFIELACCRDSFGVADSSHFDMEC